MYIIRNDLFFSYKNVIRYLIIQKYGFFSNTNQLPYIRKTIVFFDILNLTDVDDARSFNYAYFFRFFFGRRCYFSKYNNIFHLGVNFFSFRVQCVFLKSFSYFPLQFFLNDVLGFTDRLFFRLHYYGAKSNFFLFNFYDMSVFIEKKTNIGFYNLKDPLNYKLFISGNDTIASYLLLKCFKI